MVGDVGESAFQGIGELACIRSGNGLPVVGAVAARPVGFLSKNGSGRLPAVALGKDKDGTPLKDVEVERTTLAFEIHTHRSDSLRALRPLEDCSRTGGFDLW